jgi:Domain of unknown function (DUF4123)
MANALSYAQLKAALWARQGVRVHAVLDGRVVPGLPGLLEKADLLGWDCLERGALSAQAARQAPYLAELREASPFSDWLLAEAGKVHPGWGLVMVSLQPMLAVREHCRSLDDVVLPDGERHPWRWYDPELLAALLPSFSPSQLDELFALGQQIVVVGSGVWTWHGLEQGVLASTERALMDKAL